MNKLPLRVTLAYAAGEFGFILLLNTFDMFVTYFFTDVILLPAALMGVILFLGRILDAVSVPLSGVILDRSRAKGGVYRTWIGIGAPVTAVLILLFFTKLKLPGGAVQLVYYVMLYGLIYLFNNLLYTSYLALNSVLADTAQGRVRLSATRGQTNALAKIVQSTCAIPLVLFLGRGDEARGFFWMILVMCTACVAGFACTFFVLKGREAAACPCGETLSVGEIFRQFSMNPPLRKLFLAEAGKWFHLITMYAMATYYCKYILHNVALVSVFYLAVNVSLFAGAVAGRFLAGACGQERAYRIGLGMLGLFSMAAYFSSGHLFIFVSFMALANAGFGVTNAVSVSLFSDTVVYGEWATGSCRRGFVMSMYTFNMKFAYVLSSIVVSAGLSLCGYEANVAASSAVIFCIRFLMTAMPGLVVLLGAAVFSRYPLNKERVEALQREINERY